jgi:aldose 1-epimerase
MNIEKRLFGYTKIGRDIDCYTLTDGEMSAKILTYGGSIRSLTVPAPGGVRDVVLGFDDVAGYTAQRAYHGALIGRVANRIGGARFSLNGRDYILDANDGANCLHGGLFSFDRLIWDARTSDDALVLSLQSPDLEGGFPGDMDIEVCYSLKDDALIIEYTAECSADTPISLTNHVYFNLGGHSSGSIGEHLIQIFSDAVTLTDESQIPTGELLDVTGTLFDLRKPKAINDGLFGDHPQIAIGDGYDQNFVLSREPHQALSPAAVLEYDGLKMTCLTTQPGIQLYTGNRLSGDLGKGGAKYGKHSGLCLETQAWPDAINCKEFPDSILRKGGTYNHTTIYKFER